MKGIILAGGAGSRLMPLTLAFSKQLLPIYDKPMIYYPLSVLMLAGIREIQVITTESDQPLFHRILGDGSSFGIELSYKIQDQPNGIAEAFILAEDFIGKDSVSLILGDNIFFGHQFGDTLVEAKNLEQGAKIFTTFVDNPSEFGVAEVDDNGHVISIEEKPMVPKSNLAVTGLYFYDNSVVEIAKKVIPSKRGEYEITDINNAYKIRGDLKVELLGRGFAWLDTGTINSLMEAGQFVQTIENSQGLKIACLEEIAFRNGWLSKELLLKQVEVLKKSNYGNYLNKILKDL